MKKSNLFKSRISSIKRCSEDLSIFTAKELYSYSCLVNKIMRKMFAKNYLVFMFSSVISFAQNDSLSKDLRSTVFSFTPRTKTIDKVNGLAVGFGIESFTDNPSIEKVNGLNLEVNPASILIFWFADPRGFSKKESVKISGLHLSTGNVYDSKINGVAFSFFNINYALNGFSISGVYSYVTNQSGFHISGISNISQKSNGVIISMANHCQEMRGFQFGIYNGSEIFKGLQLGLFNTAKVESKGLQLGFINHSKQHKGFQLGFWNVNHKRSFPFLNW